TVERKEGRFVGPASGRTYRLLDLPGAYSLEATSLDEAIARDVVLGRHMSEPPPDLLVCVVDATNLRLNLRLVLDLKRLGRPMIVALNMSDVAEQRGYQLDRGALEQALGVPVIRTVAVRSGGERGLLEAIDAYAFTDATLTQARRRSVAGSGACCPRDPCADSCSRACSPAPAACWCSCRRSSSCLPSSWRWRIPAICRARPSCSIASWGVSDSPGGRSSRCCRVSPAPFPASWRRAPSPPTATASRPS